MALTNLQASSEAIAAQTLINKESQTTTFGEFHELLMTQRAILQTLQRSNDVITTQATQNKEMLEDTTRKFGELSKKIEEETGRVGGGGGGGGGGKEYKEVREEMDKQMTAIGVIQHSMVNMHQSMDILLKRTLRSSVS